MHIDLGSVKSSDSKTLQYGCFHGKLPLSKGEILVAEGKIKQGKVTGSSKKG